MKTSEATKKEIENFQRFIDLFLSEPLPENIEALKKQQREVLWFLEIIKIFKEELGLLFYFDFVELLRRYGACSKEINPKEITDEAKVETFLDGVFYCSSDNSACKKFKEILKRVLLSIFYVLEPELYRVRKIVFLNLEGSCIHGGMGEEESILVFSKEIIDKENREEIIIHEIAHALIPWASEEDVILLEMVLKERNK